MIRLGFRPGRPLKVLQQNSRHTPCAVRPFACFQELRHLESACYFRNRVPLASRPRQKACRPIRAQTQSACFSPKFRSRCELNEHDHTNSQPVQFLLKILRGVAANGGSRISVLSNAPGSLPKTAILDMIHRRQTKLVPKYKANQSTASPFFLAQLFRF